MSSNQTSIEQIRFALFNTTGPRYDLIMPAFGPLAESLVKLAKLQPNERVLDLGTGTGAVALPVSWHNQVAGIDYAPTMLQQAQHRAGGTQSCNLTFYQGNMNSLPHPTSYFEVALASFGFNGIDPVRVFPEVWRVLKPNGRLIFQEWGEVDQASKLVKQAVKARKVKQADGFLAGLRRLGETPKAWDTVGGAKNIARLLKQVGFGKVQIIIEQEAIPLEPLTFFKYKTAWTPYQAELNAMSQADRTAIRNDVIKQLSGWAKDDGQFVWQPELLRVMAWK